MTAEDKSNVERAFGESSRRQLLDAYFARHSEIQPSEAWKHVYRLLLWIDRRTGLAHCYESDKSQPGRPWYERSLAFHGWLSAQVGATPDKLGEELDWLFIRTSERLAAALMKQHERRSARAEQQRAKYEGFPNPGEDPGLERIIVEGLRPWLSDTPPPEALKQLSERIHTYYSQENKRKNLLGEGFEDVLQFLIRRIPNASTLNVMVRPVLHEIAGFRSPPRNEKPRTVDLAVVRHGGKRVLATVKWSVRADREEQFGIDFEAYARLEEAGEDFDFVLVTNEFDAARLAAACERRRQNAALFSRVVHVNPKGPIAAYGDSGRGAAVRLAEHVASGRLQSLADWLSSLA